MTVHHGDCRAILATFADASIDAIVTDPPYELGFMGKHWDASGIAYDPVLWSECLRVLKPGGHLLAFGGTRTYHRMAVAIEDAGFEVRDSIHWLYGSGFPKSLDVSKAIDRQRDDLADIYRVTAWVRAARDAAGIGNRDIDDAFGFAGMAGHWTSAKSQPAVPTLDQVPTLLDVLGLTLDDVPDDIRRLLWDLNGRKGQPGENWWKREVVGERAVPIGHSFAGPTYGGDSSNHEVPITTPATDAARQWDGWGTALKPAHEPIVVARKSLIGTVAANVLEHGTGAINVDGARVATSDANPSIARRQGATNHLDGGEGRAAEHNASGRMVSRSSPESFRAERAGEVLGRWPANIVFTHAADCGDQCAEGCPVAALDEQSDTGGASRFFTVTEWDVPFRYIAKPSKRERNAGLDGNHHPTVKPLALMRWLVRLVTPPGGIVLDPFLGSGTTAAAAVLEGFDWVGCEMTAEYLPIIEGRVAWAHEQAGKPAETHRSDEVLPFGQLDLFGGEAA